MIVVDNPERDDLSEIIEFYKQCTEIDIIVIKNKNNSGIVLNLNKAIKYSSYEYIARMDADDISSIKTEYLWILSIPISCVFG